jgi:hypothetical protein
MISELELAAYHTVHNFQGGAKALASRIGLAPSTLSNKVDPSIDSHKLSLAESLALMLVTGDFRILHVLAAETGHIVIPKGEAGDGSDAALLELYAKMDAEQGDVAKALLAALEDGRFTSSEVARISKEVSESIAAQQAFLKRLRGLCPTSAE